MEVTILRSPSHPATVVVGLVGGGAGLVEDFDIFQAGFVVGKATAAYCGTGVFLIVGHTPGEVNHAIGSEVVAQQYVEQATLTFVLHDGKTFGNFLAFAFFIYEK